MSRTLNIILKHWNGNILDQAEQIKGLELKKIELPFNLELVCQEIDEDLQNFDEIKKLLKEYKIDF